MDVNVTVLLAAILLIELSTNSGVKSFKIITDPTYIEVSKSQGFSVECTADPSQPITGCQFRVWYVDQQEQGVLLNVPWSEKTETVTVQNPYNNRTNYTADLYGSQFNTGSCTVYLYDLQGSHLLIGCKLTNSSGQSAIATTPVFIYDVSGFYLSLETNSKTLYVEQGESVNILIRDVHHFAPLKSCSSTLVNGDNKIINTLYNQKTENNVTFVNGSPAYPRYTPYEGTLNRGECGFTINNVTERDNGVFFVLADGRHGFVAAKAVTLVVASLKMAFSKEADEFFEGEVVKVTCTARGVRDLDTRWRWWLDDEDITSRAMNQPQVQPVDGWRWPWEDTDVTQSITLNLTQEHHGKTLSCWVNDSEHFKYYMKKEKQIKIQQKKPNDFYTSAETTPKTTSSKTPTTTSSTTAVAGSNPSSLPIATTPGQTAPTSDTKNADLTPQGSGFDHLPTHIIITYAVLAVFVFVVTAVMVDYIRRTRRCCFKDKRRQSSQPEPAYEEIDESLALANLSPPPIPWRAETKNLNRLTVPKENAPDEPDYIIPDAPDAQAIHSEPSSTGKRFVLPKLSARARPLKPSNFKHAKKDDSLDADGYLKVIKEDINQANTDDSLDMDDYQNVIMGGDKKPRT